MKLSTLLLSSAAVLVAGSAYAADLPAKKGAPAAKAAAGCPAFGAGFFQIPGGDNCIQFGGHMKYVGTYANNSSDTTDTSKYSQTPTFQLNVDVRSNSDAGVIRGVGRLTNGTRDRAYVQFAGITAGQYGSTADFAGTGAENFGSGFGGGTGVGVKYDAAVGGSTVTLALENAAENNQNSSRVADRPDVLLGIKTSVGGASFQVVGVSHEVTTATQTKQGSAILARIGFTMGSNSIGIYGAQASGAGDYTDADALSKADSDTAGGELYASSNYGVTAGLGVGSGTVNLNFNQASAKDTSTTTRDQYGVSYVTNIAKGLAVEPEFIYSSTDANGTKTNSSTVYLRIQRDF